MKMKKQTAIKILAAALTVLMLVTCMQSTVFATTDYLNPDNIQPVQNEAATKAQNVAGQILSVVQVVAISVAVIMLIVLAIKYISAAPDGKADVKKMAFIYVFGAILLFGASGILQVIKQLGEAFNGDASGNHQ